ncbi:hypothetical protein [Catenuloplanes japonicus]|nr:hypothetical protein [Catenuloplanes japonicus]
MVFDRTLPQAAENVTGPAPESPEFIDGYREQLRRIVARLG